MQTMMVQPPPAPAAPPPGKTSAPKGRGLFEGMLGDHGDERALKPQEEGGGELLAAAALTPWPPAPPLDAPLAESLLLAASGPAASTPEALPTALAAGQGLAPGANPQQPLALLPAQVLNPAPAEAQAQGVVQGQSQGLAVASPEPVSAPEVAAKAGVGPSPANPAAAPVAPLSPSDAVVKIAAGPAAPAPPPYPQAEVVRMQQGLAANSSLAEAVLLPAEADNAEPLLAGGPKPGGLSEARFSEMLQGAAPPRSQAAAPRTGGQRLVPFEVAKEAAAGARPAAAGPPLALDAATSDQVDPVLPSSGAPSTVAPTAGSLQAPAAANLPAPPPVLTLPSGQVVSEGEVLGQVLGRLRLGAGRDSSSISLKLNPEELGEVKLEMVVEKDRVRAMIQAQNQQVQEVLERHLPRLREALQQQGLKLEEVQVSVDSRQQENHRGFSQDQRPGAQPSRFGAGRSGIGRPAELPVSAQAAAGSGSSGLSIRI